MCHLFIIGLTHHHHIIVINIFNIILQHKLLFDIKAVWNYFETGHGKGPCNGLVGTTKRMADNAIKQRKYVIQDTFDFYS